MLVFPAGRNLPAAQWQRPLDVLLWESPRYFLFFIKTQIMHTYTDFELSTLIPMHFQSAYSLTAASWLATDGHLDQALTSCFGLLPDLISAVPTCDQLWPIVTQISQSYGRGSAAECHLRRPAGSLLSDDGPYLGRR